MTKKHKWDKEIRALLDGERVEMRVNGSWLAVNLAGGISFFDDPYNDFRIAPKTISINGYEFPEPLRVAPESGSIYYITNIVMMGCYYGSYWWGDDNDFLRLNRGLIHSTKEAAIAHAKAIILASGGSID